MDIDHIDVDMTYRVSIDEDILSEAVIHALDARREPDDIDFPHGGMEVDATFTVRFDRDELIEMAGDRVGIAYDDPIDIRVETY